MIHYCSDSGFSRKFKIEILTYPPYNQNLAPSDLWLFLEHKKRLQDWRFKIEEAAIQACNILQTVSSTEFEITIK